MLNGRELHIRLYSEWYTNPEAYDSLLVVLEDGRFTIPAGLSPEVILLAHPGDQRDAAVSSAMGQRIQGWPFGRETARLSVRRAHIHVAEPEPNVTLNDALGQPIAHADVWTVLSFRESPAEIMVDSGGTDANGRVYVHEVNRYLHVSRLWASHPEYGTSELPFFPSLDRGHVWLSLVRSDSPAYERALRGIVTDATGHPVAGAAVVVDAVRTPGEGLISPHRHGARVITDEQGRFHCYPHSKTRRDERGELIPPNSRFNVHVDAPGVSQYPPHFGWYRNNGPVQITLQRGDTWRRFVFLDKSGNEITDPKELDRISVVGQGPESGNERSIRLRPTDWREGGYFLPGRYTAQIPRFRGVDRGQSFACVEISDRSPSVVVFRLPADIAFEGRVLHGVTREPIDGAFVIPVLAIAHGHFSELTSKEWELLHALAAVTPTDPTAALEIVQRLFSTDSLVRTGADGVFEVSRPPTDNFYSFTAFAEDYVAMNRRVRAENVGAERPVPIPDLLLFPAARVRVGYETQGDPLSVAPRWRINRESSPPWIDIFFPWNGARNDLSFIYDHWLRRDGEPQWVHVPAGVDLQLELRTPYDEKWCHRRIPRDIFLGQGETLDLGVQTFEPAIPVKVRAVNAEGAPVEGAPVRVRFADVGSVAHNSDALGFSFFYVAPYATGSFYVHHYDRRSKASRKEAVVFEMGGPQDSGREFRLVLSEQMIQAVLTE